MHSILKQKKNNQYETRFYPDVTYEKKTFDVFLTHPIIKKRPPFQKQKKKNIYYPTKHSQDPNLSVRQLNPPSC